MDRAVREKITPLSPFSIRSPGNFFVARDITLSEDWSRLTIEDALPALVLNSEVLSRDAMDETPSTSTNPRSTPAPATTGVSDERLMLAFSAGSPDAFTQPFSRSQHPIECFSRPRV